MGNGYIATQRNASEISRNVNHSLPLVPQTISALFLSAAQEKITDSQFWIF